MSATKGDIWYRYAIGSVYRDGAVPPVIETFRVVKTTAKGVWIEPTYFALDEKRFVLRDAKKRFACPTIEEAKESFLARMRLHIGFLTGRLERAEDAVANVDGAVLPAYVELSENW